ncbi:hypothetical protein RHS02_00709, partial [Rhizoctonia solani]
MFNLPNELVGAVISYSNKPVAATLALLNRRYNRIATPFLYEKVTLKKRRQVRAFHWALVQRPAFQGYVRTLELLTLTIDVFYPDAKPEEDTKQLLMKLPQLVNLVLNVDHYSMTYLFNQPEYPFLLRRFSANSIKSKVFIKFLESQNRIESICLKPHAGLGRTPGVLPVLEPHVLPNLRQIDAVATTVMNLVPSRPVSRISVDRSWDRSYGMYNAIPRSTAPLTYFRDQIKLSWGPWGTQVLELIEKLGHNPEELKELVIHIAVSDNGDRNTLAQLWVNFDPTTLKTLADIRSYLTKFCNLSKFRLEGLIGGHPNHPELQFGLWEKSCPLLEEFTLFNMTVKRA